MLEAGNWGFKLVQKFTVSPWMNTICLFFTNSYKAMNGCCDPYCETRVVFVCMCETYVELNFSLFDLKVGDVGNLTLRLKPNQ